MPGGVEQHSHGGLWLVGRHFGPEADRVGNRLVQVVDLDLEVHRHLRLAGFGGPYRADVAGLGLEAKVVPASSEGETEALSPVPSSKSSQSSRRL